MLGTYSISQKKTNKKWNFTLASRANCKLHSHRKKHGIKKTTFGECIIDHTQVANRVHIATATARVLFDITYSRRAPLLQFNSLNPTSHKDTNNI
jgi:hypothetical protein